MMSSSSATMMTDVPDAAMGSPTSVTHRPEHQVEVMVLPKQHDEEKQQSAWIAPASAKSLRTVNPIRAIVDPIVANVKQGWQRQDGKDPISLAVRSCHFCLNYGYDPENS